MRCQRKIIFTTGKMARLDMATFVFVNNTQNFQQNISNIFLLVFQQSSVLRGRITEHNVIILLFIVFF